jgi:hypothetical protein
MPDSQVATAARDDQPHKGRALALAPPKWRTLTRAAPSLVLIVTVCLLPLWGVLKLEWSVLAVVSAYVADGAADGLLAWRRARLAQGEAGQVGGDRVLVREFVRTYFTVVLVMALVVYMVFSGRLFKPDGLPPEHPYAAFASWQFWAIIVAFFAMRALVYLWDWVYGDEAVFMPPAAVVGEPLRRLFVLQFGVVIIGFVVYWKLDSSTTGLVVLVLLTALANLVLAVFERLRAARIRAAVAAGIRVEDTRPKSAGPARAAKAQPRAGRKRGRKR